MSRSVAEMLGRQVRTKMLPLDVNWPLPENLMGIELEIEYPQGSRRTISDTVEFRAWSRHQDGSLANGREYVLRTPLAGKQLTEAIAEIMMYGPFDKNMRGSTHVHMDMLDPDTSHETLRILILLVYSLELMMESKLARVFGARSGNEHTMRAFWRELLARMKLVFSWNRSM